MSEHDRTGHARVKAARGLAIAAAILFPTAATAESATPVRVELTEWSVRLEPATVPAGPVHFTIENRGQIPHAFEVEGNGIDESVPQLAAGAAAGLDATLGAGTFDASCPIGNGSHRMLGMAARLVVTGPAKTSAASSAEAGEEMAGHAMRSASAMPATPRTMRVRGGGTVIQILPGPFPFADSARAVIAQRPADQKADLEHKAAQGPYSNRVAVVTGAIDITATDRGATGDSVNGTATFTTADGARWRLVIDRVQTRDIPFNPRFGGVIMGLYYHGASGVHTPLVPTIQSSLALWAFGHLYRDGALVTDDAMVHVMLLSRTRRPGDWALACWDCSRNPVDELQLQVTPSPGEAPFDAPEGVLFLNWEKSSGEDVALR